MSAFPGQSSVTSFNDGKVVAGLLRTGNIVVSAFEKYLVPFFTDKLYPRQLQYVAAVQGKFSKNENLKGGDPAICDRLMKLPIVDYLQKEENVTCFLVLHPHRAGRLPDR